MTVNEAIIVCEILKTHGFGDYSLTVECGFCGLENYPDYYREEEKIINREGYRSTKDRWCCSKKDLVPICEEIEKALRRWKHEHL